MKYPKHFAGPIWWLAPLMFLIEIISTLARPLSLSVRLFANMYAGEQVTLVFLSLTYLVVPAFSWDCTFLWGCFRLIFSCC